MITQSDIIISFIRNDSVLFPLPVYVDDSIYFSDDLQYDLSNELDHNEITVDQLKNIIETSITEDEIISVLLKYNEFITEFNDNTLYIVNKLLKYFEKLNVISNNDYTDDLKVMIVTSILKFIKSFSKYFVLFIMTMNKDEIEVISKSISVKELKIDSLLFRNIKSYSSGNEQYIKILIYLVSADNYNILETLKDVFEKNPLITKELVTTISVAAEKMSYYYIIDEVTLRLLQELMAKNIIDKINLCKLCLTYTVQEIKDNLIDVLVHS